MERTYVVEEDAAVPALESLPGVARVTTSPEETTEALHHDTDDLALTRSGIVLRRRTAGAAAGWELELPAAFEGRELLHAPPAPSADAVPDELRSLVQVRARGRDLGPVAAIRSRRVVHRLLGEDGAAVGELADEHVTLEAGPEQPGGGLTVSSWRQWSLVAPSGGRDLLEAADGLLDRAGARPSTPGKELARALRVGPVPSVPLAFRPITEREPSPAGPAAVVVLTQLRAQVEELQSRDPGVRRDVPDTVHRMRVASRRLRSALASFRKLLDRAYGDELRAELKWLADVLGEARDAEVMRDRLTAMAADPGAGDRAEPLPVALETRLDDGYGQAHARVLEALDSPRYFRLLDALDRLVAEPPWEPAAELPAREVLPARARSEWRRLGRKVAAVDRATDEHERDLALHEVRKAAKRLRYACEALVPAFGSPAAETAAAAERLQEVLGNYQDSVVSQGHLRELATREEASGDDALVLGRLHRLEQEHAEQTRGEYDDAWTQLSRKRLRGWMHST